MERKEFYYQEIVNKREYAYQAARDAAIEQAELAFWRLIRKEFTAPVTIRALDHLWFDLEDRRQHIALRGTFDPAWVFPAVMLQSHCVVEGTPLEVQHESE